MKKVKKRNQPAKGSRITVDPIRRIEDIRAISKLLEGSPRDHLLFVMGVNNGIRTGDLLKLKVRDVRNLKSGDYITIKEGKTKKDNVLVVNKTVYKALKILADNGVSFEHTLIGDGEDRESILELIGKLELGSVTRWLGTQPHHVVLDHYRASDLFVLGCEVATNGDRDGIPNVLVESMAMGVPVVATDISAIPELVQGGETGLLVPVGDVDSLASGLLRLGRDGDLRRRLGANAAREQRRAYTLRAMGEGYLSAYAAAPGTRA